jgi:ParB-like chromosome segregation protein Spo0J
MTYREIEERDQVSSAWRDQIEVHPAADLFQIMATEELKALGSDIEKRGLTSPIAITITGKKLNGDCKYWLLDGRNRLDAMELAGVEFALVLKDGQCTITSPLDYIKGGGGFYPKAIVVAEADATAYVVSANIHRRHLTVEQKRGLIARVLKAQPSKSNREIARQVKDDHHKVGAVRRKLEATGEVSPVEKTIGADGKARATAPKKRRRDIEDYLAEKKAKQAATDAEVPAPPPEQTSIADTSTSKDEIPPEEQLIAFSNELRLFMNDYLLRVEVWWEEPRNIGCRGRIADVLEEMSHHIQAMAQSFGGSDSNDATSLREGEPA